MGLPGPFSPDRVLIPLGSFQDQTSSFFLPRVMDQEKSEISDSVSILQRKAREGNPKMESSEKLLYALKEISGLFQKT